MALFRLLIVLCLTGIGCAHPSNIEVARAQQPIPSATSSPEVMNQSEEPWRCFQEVVSATTAVTCAEEFIKVNGYTQAPALPPNKLTTESIEWSMPDDLANLRHNSLQPSAYGYLRGRRGKARGWTVIFCHTRGASEGGDRPTGRAVTMDQNGASMRVEHVDIFLDAAEEFLKPCAD